MPRIRIFSFKITFLQVRWRIHEQVWKKQKHVHLVMIYFVNSREPMWIRIGLRKLTNIFCKLHNKKRPFSNNITSVCNKLLELVNNKTKLHKHTHNMKPYHHQKPEEPNTRLNIRKLVLIINISITKHLFGYIIVDFLTISLCVLSLTLK